MEWNESEMETRTEIEKLHCFAICGHGYWLYWIKKIIWIGIINFTDIKSMSNGKIGLNSNEWVERIAFHAAYIFCNVGSDLLHCIRECEDMTNA